MVKAGIIGLGWWGQELLKSAAGSEAIRFVHGVARRAELGAPVAEKFGLRFSGDFAAMLRDPEVEAVVLATPHRTHLALIEAVAAAKKPVFCEKPLTLTRAEAVQAVAACTAAGVPLCVGHNRRFVPSIVGMREIVASGRLGRLLHIEGHSSNQNSSQNFAPWRADPEESPAGGMTGTGVHVIDAFTNLVGPAVRVATQHRVLKAPPDARDSISVLFEFANGMSGTLAAVRATPRFWRLHVFGDLGHVESTSETELVLCEGSAAPEVMRFAAVDTLRAELEAFAAAAQGKAAYPLPVEQAIANVAAFEAIVRSLAAGGAAVAVEG